MRKEVSIKSLSEDATHFAIPLSSALIGHHLEAHQMDKTGTWVDYTNKQSTFRPTGDYMDPSGGYIEDTFVADFYDYIVPHYQRQDISFFVESALRSEGPVLELGCGTGRILLPIATTGKQIVGLDRSLLMLLKCQKKLLYETDSIRSSVRGLICGDMRWFYLKQKFNLVAVPFYTFNYLLTIEDQISCLSSIYHHLIKGGRLILDLPNPSLPYLVEDQYMKEFGDEPEFVLADGRRGARRFRIKSRDLLNQVIVGETIYYISYPDGRKDRLVNDVSMRYLFRYEAEHLLIRCGFIIEDVYADYTKSSFGSKYPGEMIFVARRD